MSASRIYQDAIKTLAAEATGHGRLPEAQGRACIDNPLCGDSVEMEVALTDGRIAAVAHRVKGCLLCRAAASIIGKHAPGSTRADIDRVSVQLDALLQAETPAHADWPELESFAPVHAHRSRYRCVQLPFQALAAALRAAES